MSKELVRTQHEILSAQQSELRTFSALAREGNVVKFRYSSTEITSQGRGLHVKMKETRFAEGKLVSQECEGILDEDTYKHIASNAQRPLFTQLVQLAGLAGMLFAPFLSKGRRDQ